MLEYTYDEALELLNKNYEQAKETKDSLDKDLDFIKDQITTTEVNIARVYNQGDTCKPRRLSILSCSLCPYGRCARQEESCI